MKNLYQVIDLQNEKEIGKLNQEAHGVVKSTKYFPIYEIEGKEKIFKPLSKTKPLTTPLFAFSEVFWSYIIKKYFEPLTPRYYLAKRNVEVEPKYYKKGVLVESINKEKTMFNIYDYFLEHEPDRIEKDYVNYCLKNYDYTNILQSNLIKNNPKLGENLSYQILLSILRQDQNFHYENINLFQKENEIILAPPIDFEFSSFFLYPELELERKNLIEDYKQNLGIQEEDETTQVIAILYQELGWERHSEIKRNLFEITRRYPHIVLKFIKRLEHLIENLPNITIEDPNDFITPLSSEAWQIGHYKYKEPKKELEEKYLQEITLVSINKEETLNQIVKNILEYCIWLNKILKIYLISYTQGMNLEELTAKKVENEFEKINIEKEINKLERKII